MLSRRLSGPSRVVPRLGLALTALLFSTIPAFAQNAKQTFDSRWTPWLGCWQKDSSSQHADAAHAIVTCITPLAGTSGVQEATVAYGKITARRHLVADAKPTPFEDNGCKGTRTSQWAADARRVYTRSSYTCGAGLAGTSSGILSLTPAGDFVEAEAVRAGHGSIEHVDVWHDAGTPDGLPAEITSAVAPRRLAATTARAAIAVPLSVDDVLDAVQHADSTAVRAWIASSGQRFNLGANDVAMLMHASVPRGVLQAIVAWSPQAGASAPGYDPDAYLKAASGVTYAAGANGVVMEPGQPSYPMYCAAGVCYPADQYSSYNGYAYPPNYYYPSPYYYPVIIAPFIVNRRPFRPGIPRGLGPVGLHPFQAPIARPPTHPVVRGPSGRRP